MTGASAMAGTLAGGMGGAGSGSGFSVNVPSTALGSNSGAASSGTVTASATATVVGGTSPYTHAWSLVSGDPSIVLGSPSSASPGFSAVVSNATTPKIANFKDTVTDSLGVRVASNAIEVSLDWIDTR